jgi:hypothetical protein
LNTSLISTVTILCMFYNANRERTPDRAKSKAKKRPTCNLHRCDCVRIR